MRSGWVAEGHRPGLLPHPDPVSSKDWICQKNGHLYSLLVHDERSTTPEFQMRHDLAMVRQATWE